MVAPTNKNDPMGLEPWHSYSIFGAYSFKGEKIIKLRNPWGNREWRGDWCDSDQVWELEPSFAKAVGFY